MDGDVILVCFRDYENGKNKPDVIKKYYASEILHLLKTG